MGKNSNISDEDILKEETQPGVVVYRSNVPKGAGVFDMDIAPGIKEVTIKYDLLMLGCEKSFPDVEKLIIGEDVVSIEILNTLFPNVRWVLSMNYEFETGSYLVYNHVGFKTLLNAFCRGADETIDLGDIDSIDNFAFKGCESLNIIGGEDIKDWQAIEQDAFSESALKNQPFKNGIKKAGHIIVDIDYTADEIDIPDDRLKKIVFSSDIDFTKIKKLIIHRPETVEQINYQYGCPDTLVLNTDLLMHEQDVAGVAHFCTSKTYIRSLKTIESHIPQYKTVDGVLYNKDMSALLVCPRGKNGNITISEGVTKIKEFAFANSKVEEVSFPDTLKKIEKHAFYECSRLKSVDFGNGIEEVGGVNVFAFSSIAKLEIPPQVKAIGDGAFYYCNKLKEVKFNEGLQEIGNDAFSRCDLIKNLDFPETLRYIGNRAFHPGLLRTEDIVVNLKSIPCNFIAAFVKEERSPGTICINVHMNNAADVFDFVIPEYMSHYGFLTTDTAFDMLPDKKAAETLNEAYVFAISTTSRSIAAFKAYRKTRDEKIKKEIQENYLLTALSIIAFMNEDDFMDFLKLVEVRYNKRILNRLQKKGWLPSVSYILQNAKETEKEDFTLS